MEFNRAYYEELAVKLERGTITDTELDELIHWYNHFGNDYHEMPENYAHSLFHLKSQLIFEFEERINREDPGKNRFIFYQRKTFLIAAASILLIVSAGLYLFLGKNYQQVPIPAIATQINIAPGGDKATLTLANGMKVNLSDSQNDTTILENGIAIKKIKSGELTYAETPTPLSGGVASGRILYNTLETPRSGQYQLRLSDGTKVWLNAASTLRYPQVFTGKERRVYLSGEAFFEVSTNKDKPFKVEAGRQEVEVMGTAFNVNNYADEGQEITTLESGTVRVHAGNVVQLVKPGQRAVTNAPGAVTVQTADLETALAWKEGRLDFKEANVATIMRQISRWYNIDIAYPEGIPEGVITGGISRKSNLSSLLKILEFSHIHFKLEEHGEEKTLLVLP